LKFKNKALSLALIGSAWIHITAFMILKVKVSEAAFPDQFLQVGLWESQWDEALVDLPGEVGDDERIFGPSDRLFQKKYLHGDFEMKDEAKVPDLPLAKFSDSVKIDIDLKQKGKIAKDSSLKRNGLTIDRIRPDIEGPVSKRNVLFQRNPSYPPWAQRYGLEFEIRLKFWVLPSGEVSLVVIQDSSGYPEIDARVVRCMKRWRFNSLEGESAQTQWGTILFKFRLKR
jgi:TonB family protein